MPTDYSTLSSQVELFKTKVTALTSTTLDANDLVLLASALNTLAESMGVNDIAAATIDRIALVTAAKDAAIVSINTSINGSRLTALETSQTDQESRLLNAENYISTAGAVQGQLSATVTALDSAIRPNVMNAPVIITDAAYTALKGDRLLVVPAAGQIITLPGVPNTGDTVNFIDIAGTATATNFTIGRNGKLIQGLAEDLVVDKSNAAFSLIFTNNTLGWRIA